MTTIEKTMVWMIAGALCFVIGSSIYLYNSVDFTQLVIDTGKEVKYIAAEIEKE